MEKPPAHRRLRYQRHSQGLEFDRFVFFSDAVFAIAMTLLVVGIGIPEVPDRELESALRSKNDEILSFFISFLVIGYYWLAHHRFIAQIASIETGFMVLNLAYLAAIAFTPFPTALVGIYADHAVSVVLYATTLGTASLLEVLMLMRAYRQKLFLVDMRPDVYRYGVIAAIVPVVVFAISIPIAYVDTTLALLSWLLTFPAEYFVDKLLRPVADVADTDAERG